MRFFIVAVTFLFTAGVFGQQPGMGGPGFGGPQPQYGGGQGMMGGGRPMGPQGPMGQGPMGNQFGQLPMQQPMGPAFGGGHPGIAQRPMGGHPSQLPAQRPGFNNEVAIAAPAVPGVRGIPILPDISDMIEALSRASSRLQDEGDFTRGQRFRITAPVWKTTVTKQVAFVSSWTTGLVGLVGQFQPQAAKIESPAIVTTAPVDVDHLKSCDYWLQNNFNQFRLDTKKFFDTYHKFRANDPKSVAELANELQRDFMKMNASYRDTMAGLFFYVETLKRIYLLEGVGISTAPLQKLCERLYRLEVTGHQIFEIMHVLRARLYGAFGVNAQIGLNCFECTAAPFFPTTILVNAPVGYIPFPYNVGGGVARVLPPVQHPVQGGAYGIPNGYENGNWDNQLDGGPQMQGENLQAADAVDGQPFTFDQSMANNNGRQYFPNRQSYNNVQQFQGQRGGQAGQSAQGQNGNYGDDSQMTYDRSAQNDGSQEQAPEGVSQEEWQSILQSRQQNGQGQQSEQQQQQQVKPDGVSDEEWQSILQSRQSSNGQRGQGAMNINNNGRGGNMGRNGNVDPFYGESNGDPYRNQGRPQMQQRGMQNNGMQNNNGMRGQQPMQNYGMQRQNMRAQAPVQQQQTQPAAQPQQLQGSFDFNNR